MRIQAMKNCSVNDMLARKYVDIANERKEYTPIECEKIMYTLKVVLTECEKMFLIVLFFLLQGKIVTFCISYVVIITVKQFMGGTHRKTFWGCLLFSALFFQCVVWLSEYTEISFYYFSVALLYLAYLVLILICAPIQSGRKVHYTKQKIKRYKWYSIGIITFWVIVSLKSGLWIKSIIWWTLCLQIIEILRTKGGRKLWDIKDGFKN